MRLTFTTESVYVKSVQIVRSPTCGEYFDQMVFAVIVNINFLPSGSHAVEVFPSQTLWQYSDGDPLTGASNAVYLCRGHEKIAIFVQYLDLSRKCMQNRAIVTMECE